MRMPISRGHWILKPQNDGRVSVEQQFLVDPGGFIPAWIANLMIVKGPLASFQSLRDIVKQEKYQEAEICWLTK